MRPTILRGAISAALLMAGAAQAEDKIPAWQDCTAIADAAPRLACFDRWATSQRPAASPVTAATPPASAPATPAAAPLETPPTAAVAVLPPPVQPRRGLRFTALEGCHDARYSELSRFWELEPGANCGTFGLRVFHPISMDLVRGDIVDRQPTSDNPLNNAPASVPYRLTETRLQLSVRTKIAEGLLSGFRPGLNDSLWFAYTQQSYWQLFTHTISRPFRSTDHEPEVIYVAPLQAPDPDRWRLRFGGVGVVHQSNGQSLPLSRSWNRAYLMAGAENGRLQVHARLWKRLPESAANDDNPGISNSIGRAEARVVWHADRRNLWSVTARHSLHATARGSWRFEWFRTLADDGQGPPGGLQVHTQLFSGYGDSLLDFNRRRTVFSVGLSLVEW